MNKYEPIKITEVTQGTVMEVNPIDLEQNIVISIGNQTMELRKHQTKELIEYLKAQFSRK